MLALFNEMPAEAKNKKRIIFAEKYEDIFNDSITADKTLVAIRLFDYIEEQKNVNKNLMLSRKGNKNEIYLVYASYWMLYFIGVFASKMPLDLKIANLSQLSSLYPKVKKFIAELIKKEIEIIEKKGDDFSATSFFKSNRPKKIYEDMTSTQINYYLKDA